MKHSFKTTGVVIIESDCLAVGPGAGVPNPNRLVEEYLLTYKVHIYSRFMLPSEVTKYNNNELYTSLEDLKLNDIFDHLNTGAPQYDWTKDKKTKAQRSKLIYRIYYFTIFIQVLSIFLLFWALFAGFRLIAHMPFSI
ncbi:hypothetical protein TNCV_1783961 [Trichonephila clavipes]|nr:hypothetical protein TNCV_1783961 [Trichonephila clavipes]